MTLPPILTAFSMQSGYGSQGTAPTAYLPYAPAAYLTNMDHMSERDRMTLEWKWKELNVRSVEQGNGYMENRIDNGRKVMEEYNSAVPPENQIKMVVCIKRTII
jgi:hypothetical protein